MMDRGLGRMDEALDALYASGGRPSIAPERLLRAQLLMVVYSIRSERQLMEQLHYNLLFRWFVGLEMDDPVWDVTVFTKNRERLIAGDVSQQLLVAVLEEAREHKLLSEEHFTVDGTLIQAWASAQSFKEKKDPPGPGAGSGSDGEVLLRDKVESSTDPEARLKHNWRRRIQAMPMWSRNWPCADGEPQRVDRGGRGQPELQRRRAAYRAKDAGPCGGIEVEAIEQEDHVGRRYFVSGTGVHPGAA